MTRITALTAAAAAALVLTASNVQATPMNTTLLFSSRDVTTSLRSCLDYSGAQLTYPGSANFNAASAAENSIFTYRPAVVASPSTREQVQAVVRCVAAENGSTKIVPKSGGHSYAAYSLGGQDGSVVLDLRSLNAISVNADAKTAKIGAGQTLGPIARAIGEKGYALPHGTCPQVGNGGHTLGGGWGYSSHLWGWLVDHVVSMDFVDAQGNFKVVTSTSDGDLWYALRGAGASNFGVVTAFTYALEDAPTNIVNFSHTYGSNADCAKVLLALQEIGLQTSGGFDARFGGELLLYGENSGDDGACRFSGQHLGDKTSFKASMKKLNDNLAGRGVTSTKVTSPEFAGSKTGSNSAWIQALTDLMGQLNQPAVHEPYYAKSLMDDGTVRYTQQSAMAIVNKLQKYVGVAGTGNSISFDLNGPASKTNAKQATASAFDNSRKSLFFNQFYSYGMPGPDNPAGQKQVIAAFEDLVQTVKNAAPNAKWSAYVNYVDPQLKDWASAYYGGAVDRLKSIKSSRDPNTIFDFPQGLAHA